jgi:hypothetical protein
MNNFILTVLIAAACFGASLLSAFVVTSHMDQPVKTFGSIETPFTQFSTSSVETVTTTSAQVVATSTGRRLLILQNVGSVVAYCKFGGLVAADQQGFLLLASSTNRFPVGSEATYSGSISCISSSTIKLLANELY